MNRDPRSGSGTLEACGDHSIQSYRDKDIVTILDGNPCKTEAYHYTTGTVVAMPIFFLDITPQSKKAATALTLAREFRTSGNALVGGDNATFLSVEFTRIATSEPLIQYTFVVVGTNKTFNVNGISAHIPDKSSGLNTGVEVVPPK